MDTVSSYLSTLGRVKRGGKRRGFERALAERTVTLQTPSTFHSHILTASIPSTAGASPIQEQPEHGDLIKRYTITEKLPSPPLTPYGGLGGWRAGRGESRVDENKGVRVALGNGTY